MEEVEAIAMGLPNTSSVSGEDGIEPLQNGVGEEAEDEMQEIQVKFLGQEDPLEKDIATHYSILVWRIPWTEEPGRLQSMGS